jgi:hypothetical protein
VASKLTIDAHERSARKDCAADPVPANVAITVDEGGMVGVGAGAGAGGAMTAAAVSFFLFFIHRACPSIPPPFA